MDNKNVFDEMTKSKVGSLILMTAFGFKMTTNCAFETCLKIATDTVLDACKEYSCLKWEVEQ